MIEIHIDARKAIRTLRTDGEKQIPFALANAVNKIAKDVQTDERVQLRRAFTLRRPQWADRAVKITKFAKKADPTAVIGIHPPGGDDRADILTKFESDTSKVPKAGTIAVPVTRIGLARGSSGVLRNRARPRDLIARGKAFIVRKRVGRVGEGLILQRLKLGRGRTSIVALYYLIRRAIIKPDLKFELTARKSIDRTAVTHLQREFDNAMKTAR